MLRLTGGQFKGRVIQTVKDKAVRPTTGKVRESVFQILGARLDNAMFLDIFSGSGLMGFEALSRGARRVIGIEQNSAHRTLILKNAENLGLSAGQYSCQLGDAFKVVALMTPSQLDGGADVVFIDPPFRLEGIEVIVETLFERGLVAPDGVVAWEYPARYPMTEIANATCYDTRHYGDSSVAFFQN